MEREENERGREVEKKVRGEMGERIEKSEETREQEEREDRRSVYKD